MHFKKIEIIGFKSFAEKTLLHFEPGVTAIVGPNGCGKSNIFDSIRWVLGEQSIKSLRGTKMEDVIFNGTEKMPALNFAEVNLTLCNKTKMLPIDYEEVTISRRLFRSGESEYLLNKTQVRLKDITELLMGTGIGAESYSLVEQGKIDLVLSSRPEDRRLVFDEAAGVTKYKAKKKEALSKLEDTENNLLRINDIITEVKRQIASLERQANKARRYKEEFEKLKNIELNLSTFEINQIKDKKQGVFLKLENLKKEQLNTELNLAGLQNKLSQGRIDLETIEDEIIQERERVSACENNIQASNNHIQINLERIQELEARQNNLLKHKDDILKRIESDECKLKDLKQELGSLDAKTEEKSQLVKDNEAALCEIAQKIKETQQHISQAKNKLLDLAVLEAKARNEITQSNSLLQSSLGRKKRLDLELLKVQEEKIAAENKFKAISTELETAQDEFQKIKEAWENLKSQLDKNTKESDRLKQELSCQEARKLSLQSQKEFIEKLELKYQEMPKLGQSVILTDKIPQSQVSGILSKVDSVRELQSQEKELLKKSFGDKNLRYLLTCQAKSMPLDTVQINKEIARLENEILKLKDKFFALQNDIDMNISEIEKKQELLHSQTIVLENKKSSLANAQQDLDKLNDELSIIQTESDELDKELRERKLTLDKLNQQLSQLEQEDLNTKEGISSGQELISAKLTLRQDTLVALAQLKTEINAIHETKVSSKGTLGLLEDTLNQDRLDLNSCEKEFSDYTQKIEGLNCQIARLQDDIKDADAGKQKSQNSLNKIIEKKKQESALLGIDEAKIAQFQKSLDNFKNSIYELQIEEQEACFRAANIRERILQSYKVNVEELNLELPESFLADKATQEISALKEKLDNFGQVNLVAIEEYDELKKRFEFLTQQQNDLNTSKETLLKAIQKINRTTREMFLETFQKVGEEFRNYFRLLFGGGDAQVILTDESDVLESGIEIICRPPGKKLQNIMLLSGGEKSLSAIALIFAIFKVKPSPFCILDEIDAALDEVNIGRFNRLLQEFLNRSQFIIITHNKKTITNADIMYGITMQESGVSKIVSVKFADDKTEKNGSVKSEPLEPVAA